MQELRKVAPANSGRDLNLQKKENLWNIEKLEIKRSSAEKLRVDVLVDLAETQIKKQNFLTNHT